MTEATTETVPPREPLALQVLDKLSALVTAAFGLVAALAWNDAIKTLITIYIGSGTQLRAQIVYAVAVTVIAVLASLWIAAAITRIKKRLHREKKAQAGAPIGA